VWNQGKLLNILFTYLLGMWPTSISASTVCRATFCLYESFVCCINHYNIRKVPSIKRPCPYSITLYYIIIQNFKTSSALPYVIPNKSKAVSCVLYYLYSIGLLSFFILFLFFLLFVLEFRLSNCKCWHFYVRYSSSSMCSVCYSVLLDCQLPLEICWCCLLQ